MACRQNLLPVEKQPIASAAIVVMQQIRMPLHADQKCVHRWRRELGDGRRFADKGSIIKRRRWMRRRLSHPAAGYEQRPAAAAAAAEPDEGRPDEDAGFYMHTEGAQILVGAIS